VWRRPASEQGLILGLDQGPPVAQFDRDALCQQQRDERFDGGVGGVEFRGPSQQSGWRKRWRAAVADESRVARCEARLDHA
jgi:hypothetical protein